LKIKIELGIMNHELDKLKNVKIDEPLSTYTTFKIGGSAKYFLESGNVEEIKQALQSAREENLSIFILGGGSNILVSDSGFSGLVIKPNFQNLEFDGEKIVVGSGVSLRKLVAQSVAHSLTGLEWAVGIPGTIGGAVRGNAGAWRKGIQEVIEKVKVLREGKEIILKNKNCDFKYRHSIFKANQDIILEVILKLERGNKEKSQEQMKEYLEKRAITQDTSFPSCGCIFKNIKIENLNKEELENIKGKVPQDFLDRGVIPAAWLIDQCGLKGQNIGGAQISEKHTNFIVNKDKALAKDVFDLISLIRQEVLDKFGLILEEEVQLIGF